jgi:60 kDa SS-A/Ro ribonucleoprotein
LGGFALSQKPVTLEDAMNKKIFAADTRASRLPQADAINEAGGRAYSFTPKHALAQYAVTGCLNSTYYCSEDQQFEKVMELCQKVDPEFIGKVAVYARTKGYMKDMPALLVSVLASRSMIGGIEVLKKIFPKVIDNGKMLRNFVQVIRSGKVGRKSFGRALKRLILNWLSQQSDDQLFKQSVGASPSMADVIKMVHPKPATKSREALYCYLLGRDQTGKKRNLPALVKQYELFKAGKTTEVPNIPFQFLTSMEIGKDVWTEIARNASWQTVRMNLNTFARHGVLEDPAMVKLLAAKLRDETEIRRARVFPYQLLMAYLNTEDGKVPRELRNALQDAMEIAVNNVPVIDGPVYVFPDVSGSMSSPVTGHRKGSTSKARCIDIAALVSAAMLRRNPAAEVIPFEGHVVTRLKLNPRDSIMSNAEKLASIGGGSTNCSAPLVLLNQRGVKGAALCCYVSDQESWVDSTGNQMRGFGIWGNGYGQPQATATMSEWDRFRQRNPEAKLVCIDIQATDTTQVNGKGRADILNVGGFSDQVFNVVGDFVMGGLGTAKWISDIEAVEL